MREFAIDVIETLRKQVVVKAHTEDEACQKVVDMYYNQEINLTSDDYLETTFEVDHDFDPELRKKFLGGRYNG